MSERHQHPRRPERVAPEEGEEPRAAGGQEPLAGIGHQQALQVGDAALGSTPQPDVGGLDRDRPAGRTAPSELGCRGGARPDGDLLSLAPLQPQPPREAAGGGVDLGCGVAGQDDLLLRVRPTEPALDQTSGRAHAGGAVLHGGHRRRSVPASIRSSTSTGSWADRLDHDCLVERVGGELPGAVQPHGRVGQEVAEAASDVRELLPVPPRSGGAHEVQAGAPDGERERVEQPYVAGVPAAHAAGPHLPVGDREDQPGSGHARDEIVQERLQRGACVGLGVLGSLRHGREILTLNSRSAARAVRSRTGT